MTDDALLTLLRTYRELLLTYLDDVLLGGKEVETYAFEELARATGSVMREAQVAREIARRAPADGTVAA